MFVDEDAGRIASACADAGLDLAQLHGDGARAAFPALPPSLPVVYVLHADAGGALQTALPPATGQRCSCGNILKLDSGFEWVYMPVHMHWLMC